MPHLTEDGEPILLDELLFNYYDRKPGRFTDLAAGDGWGHFQHVDGTSSVLNGARVCSIRFAWAKDWLKCRCGRLAWGIQLATTADPEQPVCDVHFREDAGHKTMKDWMYDERERMVLDFIEAKQQGSTSNGD